VVFTWIDVTLVLNDDVVLNDHSFNIAYPKHIGHVGYSTIGLVDSKTV